MTSAWLEFPEHGIAVYRPSEKGGRYRIRYVDRDGIRRERTGGTTDREARRRVQELLERLDRGLAATATVGRLLDEYLRPENHRTRTGRPWSPRYADRQARIVRLHVRPKLDTRKEVSALTRHDFVRILNAASAVGLAPSTVADVGAVCRSIVTFAIEQRLLVDNPMLGVHFRVTSEVAGEDALAVSPDEIPTVEDVLRLSRLAGALVARRGDDAAGVLGRQLQPLFAMTSGLRFGELAALRPIDVDTQSLVVRVTRQLVEPERAAPYIDLPKGSKTRQSVFAGWLADDMATYVAMRQAADGPEVWLWPSPRGGHLRRNNHSRWWLPVRRAAGRAEPVPGTTEGTMSSAPSTRTPPPLWRIEDVAEFLNVDVRTVRRWRQTEATFPLPVELPGRTLRWLPSDLLSWIRGTHGR